MEQQGGLSNHGSYPPKGSKQRRLKVAVACDPCRARKVKCDSGQPVCATCEKRSTIAECVYSSAKEAGGCSAVQHPDLLPHKAPIGMHQDHSASLSAAQYGPHPYSISAMASLSSREAQRPIASSPKIQAPSAQRTASSRDHDDLYGADSMNGVTGDPALTCEVFGSSNANSFMRQVQAAVDVDVDADVDARADLSHTPSTASSSLPRKAQSCRRIFEDSDLFLLPPRMLADGLMSAYWDNDWVLYPIIPRREVEGIYESLWVSAVMDDCLLAKMSLINICFALGCQYCQLLKPEERVATGRQFFNRAEQAQKKLEDGPTTRQVQYLLLSGIYLQSTNEVFRCWMTVGQAVRMAQSLGLHISQPLPPSGTATEIEYKRRTWYGCVWLDQVLSATFGRPGLIPAWLYDSVPLPSMIDDKDLESYDEGSSTNAELSPCETAFFIKAIELYKILSDILVRIYLTSTRSNKNESNLGQILELDGQLQSWQKSLPPHLRSPSSAEHNAIFQRQATTLRIRFLHVRTLLFRPALIHYCKSRNSNFTDPGYTADTSLAQCMIVECSQLCFQLAREVISTFDSNLDPDNLSGPLPCWWYSVLYVYTAATVIFVERSLENKRGIQKESEPCGTWDAALRILRSYSVLGGSARKCVAALEFLSEKFMLDRADTDANTHQDQLSENLNALWEAPDLFGGHVDLVDTGFFPLDFGEMGWLDTLPSSLSQQQPD